MLKEHSTKTRLESQLLNIIISLFTKIFKIESNRRAKDSGRTRPEFASLILKSLASGPVVQSKFRDLN